MKIAVNGNIIDTINIYEITNIKKLEQEFESYYLQFEIKIFNDKEIKIIVKCDTRKHNDEEHGSLFFMNIEEFAKFFKKEYEQINSMREDIVKVWSENQTNIPQFNLKDYEV